MQKRKLIPISLFVTEKTIIPQGLLNLDHCAITNIDHISPFVVSQILELNLSNNKIQKLDLLSQFSFASLINLQSNKIASGKQLQVFKDMHQLKTLLIANNPFLEDPLEQSVLEILLQKQTDIEIFSGEMLNAFKEIEHGEIKLIFLQNYLNKVNLHQELRSKAHQAQEGKLSGEHTSALISKIIPQFYTLLEDPNVQARIKKEAIELKRLSNGSFQDALLQTKANKQEEIKLLIQDIVNIFQQDQSFSLNHSYCLEINLNQNTISFSPNRKQALHFLNSPSPPQFNQNKSKISPPKITEFYSQNQHSSEKKDHFNAYKDQNQISSKLSTAKRINFLSRTNKIEEKMKKTNNLWESKEDNINIQKIQIQNISPMDSFEKEMEVAKKNESIKSPRSLYSTVRMSKFGSENLTRQNLESMYNKNLTKMNPLFHLLYSPIHSLNLEEKNSLLQALITDHKQKFIELAREKREKECCKIQFENHKRVSKQQVEELILNNINLTNKLTATQEEDQWNQARIKDISNQNQIIHNYNRQLDATLKSKLNYTYSMEESFKKIKEGYRQKCEEIALSESYEQSEQLLVIRHQHNLKKRYLYLIQQKATLWSKIYIQKQINQQNNSQRLIKITFEGLKNILLKREKRKKRQSKVDFELQKKYFHLLHKQRIIQKNELFVKKIITNFVGKLLIKSLKINEGKKKAEKLSYLWAERHFTHIIQFKVMRGLKEGQKIRKDSIQKVKQWNTKKLLNTCFQKINQYNTGQQTFIKDYIFMKQTKKLLLWKQTLFHNLKKNYEEMIRRMDICAAKKQSTQKKSFISFWKFRFQFIKKFMFLSSTLHLQKNKKICIFKERMKMVLKQKYRFKKLVTTALFRIALKSMNRKYKQYTIENNRNKINKLNFFVKLKEWNTKKNLFQSSLKQMLRLNSFKLDKKKLNLLKLLQIDLLRGKQFICLTQIRQLNIQLELNDGNSFGVLKNLQSQLIRRESEISFLKSKISQQSQREIILMTQKDEMLQSITQSCDLMEQMKQQLGELNKEYMEQKVKYDRLVGIYNESLSLLHRKQKDFEWLYETMKDREETSSYSSPINHSKY